MPGTWWGEVVACSPNVPPASTTAPKKARRERNLGALAALPRGSGTGREYPCPEISTREYRDAVNAARCKGNQWILSLRERCCSRSGCRSNVSSKKREVTRSQIGTPLRRQATSQIRRSG